MDLLSRDSRVNKRERLFDISSEEALINAEDLREFVQQVVVNKKRSRANDGAEIQCCSRRGRRRS